MNLSVSSCGHHVQAVVMVSGYHLYPLLWFDYWLQKSGGMIRMNADLIRFIPNPTRRLHPTLELFSESLPSNEIQRCEV